jgi:hypothetical protein
MAKQSRFSRLAEMGCILCRVLGMPGTPAEIHHLRSGAGMGQRAPDHWTIPLCVFHHRGNGGIHGMGTRGFESRYGVSEEDLLKLVNKMLQHGDL